MSENLTMLRLAEKVPDEAAAYEFGRPPMGGSAGVPPLRQRPPALLLKPRNGGRQTRTGKLTQRRLWKCADCRRQFSVLTGTVMHGTKLPVRTWVFALFKICASKDGIAAGAHYKHFKNELAGWKTVDHSSRKKSDTARMRRLADRVGGRLLAYKPLVGTARPRAA